MIIVAAIVGYSGLIGADEEGPGDDQAQRRGQGGEAIASNACLKNQAGLKKESRFSERFRDRPTACSFASVAIPATEC